jgi:hypothetical protein
MKPQDVNPDAPAVMNGLDALPDNEWKHPLQTLFAYSEAIARWSRQRPVNHDEIELALEGVDLAVGQLRTLLAGERLSQV